MTIINNEYSIKVRDISGAQCILTITKDQNTMEIVKMVPLAQMYNKGLERSYKQLVDMKAIAASLATLIQSLINIEAMNKPTWEATMTLYNKFIDKRLNYESLRRFIEEEIEWA